MLSLKGEFNMDDILEPINASGQTPGQMLKNAREARQISVSKVAQKLLLSKKIVAAIEEDDYSKIPAQVYAEGYLKAYAQFLKIPTETIIESFRHLNVYSQYEVKEVKPEVDIAARELEKSKKLRELIDLFKEKHIRFSVIGIGAVLILSLLIIFIGKQFFGRRTEAVKLQGVLNNSEIADKPIPITTTTKSEEQNKQNTAGVESTEIKITNPRGFGGY
jgi:cytoskeletal protein RodZ